MIHHPDISCELARIRIAERLDEARRERLGAIGCDGPQPVPEPPTRHLRGGRAVTWLHQVTQHRHAHGHA